MHHSSNKLKVTAGIRTIGTISYQTWNNLLKLRDLKHSFSASSTPKNFLDLTGLESIPRAKGSKRKRIYEAVGT